MAHLSIPLVSLVLAAGSSLVSAQSAVPTSVTPEDGGGSGAGTGGGPPATGPTGISGAQQGASGAPSGINISKGALVAIIVVIAAVVFIGSM